LFLSSDLESSFLEFSEVAELCAEVSFLELFLLPPQPVSAVANAMVASNAAIIFFIKPSLINKNSALK